MRMNGIIRGVMVGIVVALIYGFLQLPSVVGNVFSKKSINILAWPAVFDSSEFDRFEKETGIKVYLTYFENYEELIVKMRSGTGDYDLIMTSDYAMQPLLAEQVVKPIDKSKLTFWNELYTPLLNLYFDPENMYTIPFAWETYGIGINKSAFNGKTPPASWSLLFEQGVAPTTVGMLNDAREVISIAAMYLFGKNHNKVLTSEQLDQIKNLLLKQKSWVSMYTDLRTDYLLISKSTSTVMGISSDIYQAMREDDMIDFIIPQEGSFVLLDLFMMPACTKKDDLVYQFLNFLYHPDILRVYADRYHFFPVRKGIETRQNRHTRIPTNDMFSHLSFFNYIIPEHEMRSVWIALKS